MEKIKLGLLEFGYAKENINGLQVIEDIAEYIDHADQLNFTRFWLTEHHNYYSRSSWSNPEVLIPIFLGITKRIKIGIAGVLMNYHSPYRVALTYKLLANVYPSRVDLGFANGTPPLNIASLLTQKQFDVHPNDFYQNVESVCKYYLHEEHIMKNENVIIPPMYGNAPELFLLGSQLSYQKMQFSVDNRLNFSKSVFHNNDCLTKRDEERELFFEFRDLYYRQYGCNPSITMAIPIICSENKYKLRTLGNNGKQIINTIRGSSSLIHDALCQYQNDFHIDEFILYDKSLDHSNKLSTLESLNKIFNL